MWKRGWRASQRWTVGCVWVSGVVHDQVEVQVWRGLRVGQPEEPEPLLMPMLGQARADEVSRQELQGGSFNGSAVLRSLSDCNK